MQGGIDWLESLLAAQEGVGLTAGHVTPPDADVTASSVTAGAPDMTAGTVTAAAPRKPARRRYKARQRACKCCGELFTPKANKAAKWCSDTCRQKGNRMIKAQQRKTEQHNGVMLKEQPQELCVCLWCGLDFLADPTKRPKFHRNCREKARRQRRISAIEAVATIRGRSIEDAADFVDREGMVKVTRHLRKHGYIYSEQDRRWLLPVSVGAFVEQGR